MSLPLLTRVSDDGVTFALTRRSSPRPASAPRPAAPESDALLRERMPDRPPSAGEQYRFHFDMGKCIGCKCCVVACNEQNGNPPSINWRRVGELEGGFYPRASRAYLSMGCNHCLEPTCLSGCPVDAYTKDPDTGIVRHSADQCIGCQYCTWNCSYGVPQFNPERGVVGKCDMCHGRLSMGQTPACVAACPEGAIAIEIVKTADWRASLPVTLGSTSTVRTTPTDDGSLSTTRISLPADLPPNTRARDITHVAPEHPHWPLVVMTVMTQLSVGAFATIWLLQVLGAATSLGTAAVASLVVAVLALSASTLHLGRPVHAYRALRMWRRSWLSREVVLFSIFAKVASLYAATLWFGLPGSAALGGLTVLAGLAGVTASACIYRVPSRPAWNTPYTLLQFAMTGGVLGPLFAAALGVGGGRALVLSAVVMGTVLLALVAVRFLRLIASDTLELQGTARLLSTVLRRWFVARGALLVAGALVLPALGVPLAGGSRLVLVAAFLMAAAGELMGRYLFFVSVVPRHMTAPYVTGGSEAV